MHHLACPMPECGKLLPAAVAEQLLDGPQLERFRRMLALNFVDANPRLRWCKPSRFLSNHVQPTMLS